VEDEIIVDPVDAPEIIDDFELGQDDVTEIKDKQVNKQKLRRRIEQYKVRLCFFGYYAFVIDVIEAVWCPILFSYQIVKSLKWFIHDNIRKKVISMVRFYSAHENYICYENDRYTPMKNALVECLLIELKEEQKI